MTQSQSPLPSTIGLVGSKGAKASLIFVASLNRSFSTSLFFSLFAPFWPPLGLHFGSFWAPKSAQVRSKSPLEASFFPKVDFQKNERHPAWEHDFDPKTTPKTTQDRPKTAPRRSSRASFFHFVFDIDFGPSWVRFLPHLGLSLGAQMSRSCASQVPQNDP